MNFDGNGTLTVRTYTAGGAYPVPGALVRVRGTNGENFIERSTITDSDGVGRIFTLPAPPKSYSESPGSEEIPYASYNVEISADGYYSKQILNVAIFDGIDATLPISMIPFVPYSEGGKYPRGNLNSVVTENDMLN